MPIFFSRLTACFCAAALLLLTANAGAGESDLEVLPVEKRNDTSVYHFVMQVKTNAFLDLFYYYRTRIDAYAELKMNRSLHYRQRTKTGRKTKDVVVDFDWQSNLANFHRTETFFHSKHEPHLKSLKTPLLVGTFDPLSAFYYTRLLTLQERTLIERPVSDGKRTLRASLKVIGREIVVLNGKSYDTFLVQPDLKGVNPVFEKEAGATILIWVSADNHRIPIKLKSKVLIGSFTGELVGVEGVQGYDDTGMAGGGRISNAPAAAPDSFPES